MTSFPKTLSQNPQAAKRIAAELFDRAMKDKQVPFKSVRISEVK